MKPALAARVAVALGLIAGGAWLGLPRAAGPPLDWASDVDAALALARESRRPVALSFHADWCSVCRRFDARSLRDPAVAGELERFVRVRVDLTDETPDEEVLMRRFGVDALPTLVLVDSGGERGAASGFRSADELLRWLRSVH